MEPGERALCAADLHLSDDRVTLAAWHRPFGSTDEMDEHLLQEWRRRVQPGDTVICLGDVAQAAAWRHRSMVLGPARVSWESAC